MLNERIAVYGTGTIGSCLATLVTGNSLEVVVIGHSEEGLQRFKKTVDKNWKLLIEKGVATENIAKNATKLLHLSNKPEDLKDVTFVFEAVSENEGVKKSVYDTINKHASKEVIIGSCTSSIDCSILASLTDYPERLLVTHPFQPAHLNPLIELVLHDEAAEETVERTKIILERLHRQVVTMNKSIPGFIVNRLAWTLFRESISMIEQGIATAEDINKAVEFAMGKRYSAIGLLEYYDDLGFEFADTVAQNIYPTLSDAVTTQKLPKEGLESGNTGRKAGKGLLDWSTIDEEDYDMRKQSPWFEGVKEWNLPSDQ